MTERTIDAPEMHQVLPLVGLGVSSTLYAMLLNTQFGRRWTEKQTWTTVVVGVTLTLAWLMAEDPKAAKKLFVYFAVSGLPMILRSLMLDFVNFEQMIEALTEGEGND